MQALVQQQTPFFMQTFVQQKIRTAPKSSTALTQQNLTLSRHNLLRHDNRMKHGKQNNNSRMPPPMHKLSMGKYKMPGKLWQGQEGKSFFCV